jgi:YidC/Oxa1 family membrane protein insertase
MSDFRRAVLLGLLMMIGMMLFNAWTAEHAPHEQLPSSSSSLPTPTSSHESTSSSTPSQLAPTQSNALASQNIPQRFFTLKTDTVEATFDRLGGNLVGLKLLKYPVSVTEKNTPTTLLNTDPKTFYVANSGFKNDSLNTQNVIFNIDEEFNKVVLKGQTSNGLIITKTYTFSPNDYLISLSQQIDNHGKQNWQGYSFDELQRIPPMTTGMGPFNFNTYSGGAISSPDKRYQKISFKEMSNNNLDKNIQNGWIAMIQHYFLSAFIPDPKQEYHYYSATSDDRYSLGIESPLIKLDPNKTFSSTQQLYVGPSEADRLSKIAPGLNLTVDYGVLWFIAQIIFIVMKKIHALVGNWGWSIVLVTLLIKIVFYKLNAISFKSMAKMRDIQPKIEQIRERCGDDRQKLAQATMELYRREKVNPMGGCLPLLVQIPVFLSLYWVIIESVELRQAPFILWIHDLSLKDPYYVLPLLMGITIFIQQALGPKAPDPTQRKIMMAMPVVFTALFLSFPAGLVLYWVVNNTLSILQQWYIMKHVVSKK